jgi:hypothetical protein
MDVACHYNRFRPPLAVFCSGCRDLIITKLRISSRHYACPISDFQASLFWNLQSCKNFWPVVASLLVLGLQLRKLSFAESPYSILFSPLKAKIQVVDSSQFHNFHPHSQFYRFDAVSLDMVHRFIHLPQSVFIVMLEQAWWYWLGFAVL